MGRGEGVFLERLVLYEDSEGGGDHIGFLTGRRGGRGLKNGLTKGGRVEGANLGLLERGSNGGLLLCFN